MKREYMTGLSLNAYILSKILVLGILCLIQSVLIIGVFTVSVGLPEEGLITNPFVELLITTFLAAIASTATGLFVSSLFISYKDIKPFMKDLKKVYKENTEELALDALDTMEENWGKKYPSIIASWRNNRPQLSTYFKYQGEIRKLVYTANSIKNFNRRLRKVTKSISIFPTDDALFKMLYLAMIDITKKWTGKGWERGQTLDQLCIYFGDRIQPEDIE